MHNARGERQRPSAPAGNGKPRIGRLGELFLEKGLLDVQQIEQIAQAQIVKKLRFGDAALSLGFLTQSQLDQALGEQFGYTSKDLLTGAAHASLQFLHAPFSREAEEIRRLRSELLIRFNQHQKIKVALISAGHGDGKSYMAASLAMALSQVGKRTLLIDADLRNSSQQDLFALGSPDGLSSVLAGRIGLQHALIQLMPNLHILPAGPRPPNPLEILRSPQIQNLLASCEDQFDAVVVDTYAAAQASDAQMVAHQIGAAILVARKDCSGMDALRQVTEEMQAARVELLGMIYNQFEHQAANPLPAPWFSRLAHYFA